MIIMIIRMVEMLRVGVMILAAEIIMTVFAAETTRAVLIVLVTECQNHSAGNTVCAHTKGPCLRGRTDRPPSHPKRRKRKKEGT